MRGSKAILAFLVFVFVCPATVSAQTEIKLTLPSFVGLFGLGPKTTIIIANETAFVGKVVALDKEVGMLEPGASFYERYSFDFDYTELPVAVFFYSDLDRDGNDDFVGVAGRVLQIRHGEPASWTIQTSDIHYPDGRYANFSFSSPYPSPNIGENHKVDFPNIRFKSTTALQVMNVTYYDAAIKLNGRRVSNLQTGQVFSYEIWNKYEQSFPAKLEIVFSDRGRLVGYYEDTFTVGNNPRGVQYVLDPGKIRRY